ncbi:uncharacterized protein A4U43_C09F8310 [Asparagus officinalis]|uniref:DUF868 domain-containing protein n=1 Tax=Asparagus officinalis TaxID=4686 RepID=A0A5P1E6D9_ASPOF|nr:uncharacterized protein A4U43_C09F8310 [Asparagus officinalis]
MQDPPFPIPACFFLRRQISNDPTGPFHSRKPGRVQSEPTAASNTCKVELKPWYFWRKNGSKHFDVAGHTVHVYWDLRTAKFYGEPEPQSDYYVTVVSDNEIVLLLGDLKKEAYKKAGCRPAAIEAALVSKKEHVFGKKRFSTRTRFSEKGKHHEVSIECGSSGTGGKLDPQMVLKIDGHVAIHVKHLQWKFRGNETVSVSKERVEVYWDVHDWLFSPGMRHALFIFRPLPAVHSSLIGGGGCSDQGVASSSSACCLFLYAWKIE